MLDSWDSRRDFAIVGSREETIDFAAGHWVHTAKRAILKRGRFAVALSGGSTPKAIYELLAEKADLDWSKVWLFWSDERAVSPDDPNSNYHMAMQSFGKLPIPPSQIHRMIAEKEIEKNALDYEDKINRLLGKDLFDLVMLGIGEDGHTASLFPKTKALEEKKRLVVANHVPQKNTWRMTFTYPCINQSFNTTIYALGKSKELIVPKVLNAAIDSEYPSSRIGIAGRKAAWILDTEAAKQLK